MIKSLHKKIIIIDPQLPVPEDEKQVISLTYLQLPLLSWYQSIAGEVNVFPEYKQHVFRCMYLALPPVSRRCDLYACICTHDILTIKETRQFVQIIHEDLIDHISTFLYKRPLRTYRKSTKLLDTILDVTSEIVPVYRLTISFSFVDYDTVKVPHRAFIFFSLPTDEVLLVEELHTVFSEFVKRNSPYIPHEVYILLTLQQFKHIEKGFVYGIVPLHYPVNVVLRTDYDPVDWTWVDDDPIRDPDNRFYFTIFIFVLGGGCFFVNFI